MRSTATSYIRRDSKGKTLHFTDKLRGDCPILKIETLATREAIKAVT